jgi:inner membrane transporter RhtA
MIAGSFGISLLIMNFSIYQAFARIPLGLFGVWMSADPAVAALTGLVMLSQSLTGRQWLAICCVMIACAGAALTSRPSVPAEGALP